jgi:hypothetical protein
MCVGLVNGCAEIRPKPGSEKVEIISKQQVGGDWGNQCKRLGNTTVQVGPNPSSEGSSLSPAEIEARNKAYTRGATHVAVGSEDGYACNLSGNHCGTCGYSCNELPATAYKCEGGAPEKGASASDESETKKASNDTTSSGGDTLNIQEASNVCGVETEMIRNGLSSGNLNAIQTDDGYLMSRSDVIEFCANQQSQTDDKSE